MKNGEIRFERKTKDTISCNGVSFSKVVFEYIRWRYNRMKNKNLTEEEMEMLEACQTAQDWANACDKIKEARGGVTYPDDWWARVKMTGMMDRIMSRWGEDSELKVEEF